MKRQWNRRSGQTLILFSLAIIPLLGMTGLVVDVGWMYYRKEAAQSAADSAALAATLWAYKAVGSGGAITCSSTGIKCYSTSTNCTYPVPSTASDNITAGCMYAQSNGFVNNGRQTVSMTSGIGRAPSAPGVTMSYWVQTVVTEREPQLFSGVLGFLNGNISAVATTGAKQSTGGGCVISLATTGTGISGSGTPQLNSGCGVFVNSSDPSQAVNLNGNGSITTTGTAKTEIVGGCGSSCSNISPTAVTGAASFGDPLAAMNPPTVGSCTDSSNGINMGSHDSQTISASTMGVICGGINLSSHASLTLQAGTYVVKCGSAACGISLGGQASLNGTGVTIYLPSGGVSMAGGATVSLTAPTSGQWQGILFYQDRSDSTASTLVGGTSQSMNGVLYFPDAGLTYTGGSSTVATATTIIANTISLVGNSYISSAATTMYSGNQGGVGLIQ